MSHNVETMAYVGRVPWHGLGVSLGDQHVTGDRMLEAAGLSWTVSKRPLMAVLSEDSAIPVPNTWAVVRDDTLAVMGTVSDQYSLAQNADLFRIPDIMVQEGLLGYETAGSLSDGRIVFASARFNTFQVKSSFGHRDEINGYLLLHSGHDGMHAYGVALTSVRVVCQNTLLAGLGVAKHAVRIPHKGDMEAKIDDAHRVALEAKEGFEELATLYQTLAEQRLSMESFRAFASEVADIVGADPEEKSTERKRAQARADRLREIQQLETLFGEGRGNLGATKWDAYNALCEWLDHQRKRYRQAKDANVRAENHMQSTLWGQNATHKGKALKLLARA